MCGPAPDGMQVGSSTSFDNLYSFRKKQEKELAEKIGLNRRRIDYFIEDDTVVFGDRKKL